MTNQEKDNLTTKEFDLLWSNLWGEDIGIQYRGEEKTSKDKFMQLKEGYIFNDNRIVTLDTFINGELQASEPGVIPYMEFDTLVGGSDNGIHGGICNVQYFKRYLQIDTIRSLYTSFKDKTPPII